MNKRWGELANKMGTVVEDIVAPSIQRLAREVFDCGEPQYFGTRVSLWRGIYAIAMGDEAMQVLNLDAVRVRRAAPSEQT